MRCPAFIPFFIPQIDYTRRNLFCMDMELNVKKVYYLFFVNNEGDIYNFLIGGVKMRKNIKNAALFVVLFTVVFSCTGLGFNKMAHANSDRSHWPRFIKIGSAAPGGYWFLLAAAMSEIINEKFPEINASPTSGGQVVNLRNIESGEYQIALGCNYTEIDARLGNEPFNKKLTKIRSIGNLYPSQWHIITLAEANINSIPDLKGQNYSPGTKGMGGEVMARRILAEYGMTYDDLGKMNLTSYDDAALLMKDKHISVMFIQMMAPAAAFMDVGEFFPLKILSVGEDKLEEVCKKYNLFIGEIPVGAYPGQTSAVKCPSATNEFIISSEMPDDMVYEITKALWENINKIKSVSKGLENYCKIEDALIGIGLPLHRGAYKYYIEMNMEIPENIKPID